MERLPDLRAAGGRLDLTQIIEIDAQQVLAMVEIRASRNDRLAQLPIVPGTRPRRPGHAPVDRRSAPRLQRRVLARGIPNLFSTEPGRR
jgi:hypothetical protein